MTRSFWALAATAVFCVGFGPYRPAGAGAIALGQADAVVATGTGVTALYANPANMAVVKRQSFDGGLSRDPQAGTSSVFVGGIDATSPWGLAAGVGYSYDMNWTVDSPQRHLHDLRFGLAAATESDAGKLMIGVSGRYLTGVDYVSGLAVEGFGVDVGTGAAISGFRAGLVLRNAMRADFAQTPRRLAAGIGWAGEHFLIDGETSQGLDSFSGPAYRLGLAVQPMEEGLQIRGGYAFDQTVIGHPTRHFAALGLSWRTPKYSADFSAAMNVMNVSETIIGLNFGFMVPPDGE